MERLQFLAAFGLDISKGGHIVRQREAGIQNVLVKGTHKRENLRHHVVRMLVELWQVNALPRDNIERVTRTAELIVKSLFQDVALPSIDWKKTAKEAVDALEKNRSDERPETPAHRSQHRSRTPRRDHCAESQRRDSRARSALPRRRGATAARSKSRAVPGHRLALMNTEQKMFLQNQGELPVTPMSIAPTQLDPDDSFDISRRLFQSPAVPDVSCREVTSSLQMVRAESKGENDAHQAFELVQRQPLQPVQNKLSQTAPSGLALPPKAFEKFHAQRQAWPPFSPAEVVRQQKPDADCQADVQDFVFHCSEPAPLNKLYLFYRQLAVAGVFVDLLYWGTAHHSLINGIGYKGSEAVPAVSTKMGPSINFHITTSGRVRLDGRLEQKEILASMLKRAFEPMDAMLPKQMAVIPQVQADQYQLQEWVAKRSGKVMMLQMASVFDGFGVSGVWDRLNQSVGVRGVTLNNAIPWVIMTRSRVCVAIWPSGKVQISHTKSTYAAVTAVEAVLKAHFHADWVTQSSVDASSTQKVVTYGVLGEAARQQTKLFG
eukprot:s4438_g9.t1